MSDTASITSYETAPTDLSAAGDSRPRYQYSPLPRDRPSLRLLKVQSLETRVLYRLETYSLHDAPRYDAVSYRWGDPARTRSIEVDGARLDVTQSVDELLESVAPRTGVRYLWIDFICINQDIKADPFEKDNQIPLMRDIYGRAISVVAFLGPAPDGDVRLIRDFLGKLQDSYDMLAAQTNVGQYRNVFPFKDHPEATVAFQRLLVNPYWQRAWIIQELVIPANVQMIYGGERIDWKVFWSVMRGMRTVIDGTLVQLQDNWEDPEAWSNSMRGLNCIGNIYHLRRQLQDNQIRLPLAEVVMVSAQAVATNPEDKVNALLGICNEAAVQDPEIQPDHRLTPTQVFARAVAHGLRGRCFSLLNLAGLCRQRTIPSLPSWVPDLSKAPLMYPLDHRQTEYLAGGAAPAQFELRDNETVLRIRGVTIGKIKAISQLPPTMSEISGTGHMQSIRSLATDPVKVITNLSERHREFLEMAERHLDYVYANGQSRRDALWRTMIGDELVDPRPGHYFFPAPDSTKDDYYILREILDLGEDMARNGMTAENSLRFTTMMLGPEMRSYARFNGLMGRKILGRHLAVTDSKYLCLVLEGAEVGDDVCVFSGSKTPYVLRDESKEKEKTHGENQDEDKANTKEKGNTSKGKRYELVCEAYVHGLMQGEGMRRFERTWFNLI